MLSVRCPHCHRFTHCSPEQLRTEARSVQCPYCKEVFDGLLHLERPSQPAEEPATKLPSSESDNLSSAEALTLLELQKQSHQGKKKQLGWLIGSLVLTLILCGQMVWWFQDHLIATQQTEQILVTVCQWVGCQPHRWHDSEQIAVQHSAVQTHPEKAEVLLATIELQNIAQRSQPYPWIKLELLDLNGQPLAARWFAPDDYLQAKVASQESWLSQRYLSVTLEIADPKLAFTGFRFQIGWN